MEQNIAFALSLVTMMAALSAYVRSRRDLRDAEQRLNALRSNCSIRNERGQMLRYVNASPEVRARAESTITERTA
ncbi:hypothetical protein [Novosphingobium sp. ES2-1]|uniref:hypothetical protein n=1 Tax=Novosphingobium sp. ES2-1 TaxID=2780074 RepID=UPI00187E9411|nr:hypothetical protein [Novosphingobium sp. ES2-1]QOV95240.1 hypothetical protein IM701_07430 [Novosphingobium sp. ES2-1]